MFRFRYTKQACFSVLIFLCLSTLVFLSSCFPKKSSVKNLYSKAGNVSLFIQIPQNNLVFDNISTLAYQGLFSHFRRVGYKLVDNGNEGYTLEIQIRRLDPVTKFISPDVLLFNETLRMEILCKLLKFNQTVAAQKVFNFTTLITKPRNLVMNSEFAAFAYKRMFEVAAPKIEIYFRKYLLSGE